MHCQPSGSSLSFCTSALTQFPHFVHCTESGITFLPQTPHGFILLLNNSPSDDYNNVVLNYFTIGYWLDPFCFKGLVVKCGHQADQKSGEAFRFPFTCQNLFFKDFL